MLKSCTFTAILGLGCCVGAYSQIRRTSIPLGDAVSKALKEVSLTTKGGRPFYIRVEVSEPENPQSPYHGTIEEWWSSSTEWRREVTTNDGMRQTIVMEGGKKTEKDEGDYFPLWLRSFVTALFNPVPDASAWAASRATIDQITMPNGDKSDACARVQSKIGTGRRATDAFSNVCFDGQGRLKFVGSPRYSMEFSDYRNFGKKQIARKLVDHPEPGTLLAGKVLELENLSMATRDGLFTPLRSNDHRFKSVEVSSAKLEALTSGNAQVVWPSVRSGNLQGNLAMYISVDSHGQVREAWPLNSDNAGLNDPARDQVRKWTIQPAKDSAGKPIQADGGLSFRFETVIANPIPASSASRPSP